MKSIASLPLRNLRRKPARTCALLALIAFLALSVFAGSLVILSLQNGLHSLEARLGADVIVVPSSAKSKVNLDTILLQGTTGYYYMSQGILNQVLATPGVVKASPQLFLSSLRADCCSASVQVIGIDQRTDFTITPWIAQRYEKALDLKDVVIGSKVNLQAGETLRIYGENCHVVARLESTGTGLDTAVYTSMETIRLLMTAAEGQGITQKITGTPDEVISAVYIKVGDGYSAEDVANDINLHIRKVEAVQTKRMLSGVSDSLAGIASTAKGLMLFIWVLAFAILIAAFCLLMNERRREFAVLRVIGASRRMLLRMIIHEALYLSLIGGALGILLGAAVVFPFSGLIESRLGLPFLTPGLPSVLLVAAATLLLTMAVGAAASGLAAMRLSRAETGAMLREGA